MTLGTGGERKTGRRSEDWAGTSAEVPDSLNGSGEYPCCGPHDNLACRCRRYGRSLRLPPQAGQVLQIPS